MFGQGSNDFIDYLYTEYEKRISNKLAMRFYTTPDEELYSEPDHAYKLTHKGASKVETQIMYDYWKRRYNITQYQIMEVRDALTHWDRPRIFTNDVMEHVVDVDYGREE
jgi:hypothetical protein